jgi:hypothetical protein
MRDDDSNVSARDWRVVREGETHAASKTSKNNTQESFIVGIGASGALLAGAAIVFVTLVGLVSFNVWPTVNEVSVDGNVELGAATPAGPPNGTVAPLSAASGQIASVTAGAGSGAGGANAGSGSGNRNGNGAGKGGQPKSGVITSPPSGTTTPPSTGGSGDTGDSGGSGPSAPGTATKDPTHPVHPVHPDKPHQNVSGGTHGKDNSGDDSGDVVTGKGPVVRPVVPSNPDTSSDGNGHGHGNGHGNADGHGSKH